MQKEPDYVPDGARLVQICGLCAEDGHEISFAPDDIAALMKGYEESADGSTFVQAMYERMLFGNKAFKELFRALEAGETPILFHCSAGKDRTGVAAMLILLALGASDETICADYERTNLCRKAEIDAAWRSTPKRSPQTRLRMRFTAERRAWTRQRHPSCCASSAQNTAAPRTIWKPNTA